MSNAGRPIKKYRSWFAVLFVVSFLIFILVTFMAPSVHSPAPPRDSQSNSTIGDPDAGGTNLRTVTLISIASLATSVASLFGLVVTTGIAWRKDRREEKFADIDLEKKKLELESMRLDLEKKRQEGSSQSNDSSEKG